MESTAKDRRPAGIVFGMLAIAGLLLVVALAVLWRFAQWERATGPQAADELYAEGLRLQQQGRPNEAVRSLTRSLELDPASTESLSARASAWRQMGAWQQVIDDLTDAIALDPDTADHYLERAEAHEALGRLDEAAGDYGSALDRGAGAYARWQRGWLRTRLGRYDEAVEDLTAARKSLPSGGRQLAGNLAWSLWGAGDYEEAAGVFTDLIQEMATPDLHTWFGRGASHVYRGDWEAAIGDLEQAALIDEPSRAYVDLYLWFARHRAGRGEFADQALRRRLDTSPPASAWGHALQKFLLDDLDETGLYEQAETGTDQPSHEARCEAHYYAGLKRLVAGDDDGARKLFRQCLDTGITNFYEYYGAQAELRRLDGEEPTDETKRSD